MNNKWGLSGGFAGYVSQLVLTVMVGLMLTGIAAQAAEPCCPEDENAPGATHLKVMGTNSVALGTLFTSDITNVAFKVMNTGKVPVKIERLKPTCTCATGTASTNVVPPGGTVVITVRFDPATVKGEFDRGVWVVSDDVEVPVIRLMLTGTVATLFNGIPEKTVMLRTRTPGVSLTNRFSVKSTVPGIAIGTPVITTNGSVRASFDVAARAGEPDSYDLTAVTTPLECGRQAVEILLPVVGRPAAEPMTLRFSVATGAELTAIPTDVAFTLDSQPQTFRVILRGSAAEMDPAGLAWEPKLDGVSVSALKGRRENELLVRIEVSPQGAEALYLSKTPRISLKYAGHSDAPITFKLETRRDTGSRMNSRGPFSTTSPFDRGR